jgi:hypothetical protein
MSRAFRAQAALRRRSDRLDADPLGGEQPLHRRGERLLGDPDARDAQHVADLAAERAQTQKAIAAFAALAVRLDALAAERARRPWWRRLAG